MNDLNKNDNSNSNDQAFATLIDRLTEEKIVTWKREGREFVATVQLRLEVHDGITDDGGESLRTMIVDGGHDTETHCIELSDELLANEFVELESAHEASHGNSASAAAD